MTQTKIVEAFKRRNVRATPQRIAIYSYLLENRIHPSADKIYSELKENLPSLSLTTVYNSLNLLAVSGLIIALNINEDEVRYDACVEFHGHFKCRNCDEIFDFNVDSITVSGLEGFSIDKQDLYFSGICKNCNK